MWQVSATVLALSRLVYEYAERVGVLAPALLQANSPKPGCIDAQNWPWFISH